MPEDIIAVRKSELIDLGYHLSDESAVVPRTFRRRVAGDVRLELWESKDRGLRSVWVCAWHGVEVPMTNGDAAPHSHLNREMLLRSESGPLSPLESDDVHDQLPQEPPESTLAGWAEDDLDGRIVEEAPAVLVRRSPPTRGSRTRKVTARRHPKTGRRGRRNRRRGR